MRYLVKTYISGDYVPGEIIEENESLDGNAIEWLLKSGAIEEIAPVEQAEIEHVQDEEPVKAAEPIGMPEPVTDIPDEEDEELLEAPEIDAMAGIVKEEKKTSRRRKGGK